MLKDKLPKKWRNFLFMLLLLLIYYCICWHKTDYIEQELPQALVVGVKKAGTGALRSFLRHHPDISFNLKEIKFFNHPWNFIRGYRWYVRQFDPRVDPRQVRMEKTPQYFHFEYITRLLWWMNKNLKIIIVVRDPVSRIISDHTQEIAVRKYGGSIENKLLDRFGNIDKTSELLAPSLYAKHLKRFRRYFPKENIHIVDGDKLIRENPFFELSKLEKFLGVDNFFEESSFVFNGRKGFYCYVSPLGKESCLGKSKGRKSTSVSDDIREKLHNFLTEPNKEFFRLVGQSFDWNRQKGSD